jgi:type I restriction-modification system DNA methylase subunit
MKNIFANKDFAQTELNAVMGDITQLEQKKKIILQWQKYIESGKIFQLSETQLDMSFIHQIFGDLLGYEYQNETNWQIEIKPKAIQDATRPDAVLGYFGTGGEKITRAVIELKGANINLDKPQLREKKGSPVEQAFGYVPKMGGSCKWVIVANFLEIRLYHASDSSRYERFETMALLNEAILAKFLFLLKKDRLFIKNNEIQSRIDQLLTERRIFEEKVSNEFYFQYEEIRAILFQNLSKENPSIAPVEALSATQKLIDRIIFICFVRDTLPMINILGNIKKGLAVLSEHYPQKDIFWTELKKAFHSFDEGFLPKIPHFNGGLFKKDNLLDTRLKVQDYQLLPLIDFVLKYDFQSELNVNLLGHIFEQSLSDLERLSQNTPQISLKPNQRKQDGIFYTPDYITQYIIKNTLGAYLMAQKKMLLQKHKEENLQFWEAYRSFLTQIRILDPACGSGAFLTQVFNFLYDEWKILIEEINKIKEPLDKSIKIQSKQGIFANTKESIEQNEQEWQIKKGIVQNNLFGFDINMQSVEISKLALWLLTANKFVSLADLSKNVFQVNTLLEKSPAKDFDVVIGNPPYVRQELLNTELKQALQKHYPEVYSGTADLYVYFYAKALQLLKPKGYLGFITPNKWLKTKYGTALRQYLKAFDILQITDFFELRVFEDASTEPLVITMTNQKSTQDIAYFPISKQSLKEGLASFAEHLPEPLIISKNTLQDNAWTFANTQNQSLLDKITGKNPRNFNIISLDEYANQGILYGIKTGLNKAFIIDEATKQALLKADAKSIDLIKPYISPTDIQKWHLENKTEWYFINTDFDIEISNKSYPAIHQYLSKFDKELKARQDQGKTPYNLRACAYYDKFSLPKIMYIRTAVNHHFYYDLEGFYINDSCYIISNADLFLSVFLNSKLFEFYKKLNFVAYGNAHEGGRNKLDYNKMIEVPVPQLSVAQKKPFEDMAKLLQGWSAEAYKTRTSFLKILGADLGIGKITRKLEKWDSLTWAVLQAELKKAKVSFTTKQKLQWLEVFEEEKKKCNELEAKIHATEQALDQMFFDLYGLDQAEQSMV